MSWNYCTYLHAKVLSKNCDSCIIYIQKSITFHVISFLRSRNSFLPTVTQPFCCSGGLAHA